MAEPTLASTPTLTKSLPPAFSVNNRLALFMAHTTRYAFKGPSRLAADAGISKSALSRIINGKASPSFHHVLAITKALEKHLAVHIDPRELISFDGTYPTPVCQIVGCHGCLPPNAYDEDDCLRPEFAGVKPSEWDEVTAIQPANTLPIT